MGKGMTVREVIKVLEGMRPVCKDSELLVYVEGGPWEGSERGVVMRVMVDDRNKEVTLVVVGQE